MTFDTLPTGHGPRRTTWPADGAERAITVGTRRRRRRRAATGAGSLALVGVLAGAVFALDPTDDEATVDPLARTGVERRMKTDLKACTERQNSMTTFPHVADAGYCVFVVGPRSITIGHAETWTFRMCRRTGLGPHTVAFSDPAEVRVQVSEVMGPVVAWWGDSGGEFEWHDVVFTGGECREWSVTWDARGAGVRPGRYRVQGTTTTIAFDPSSKPNGDVPAMAHLEITVRAPS